MPLDTWFPLAVYYTDLEGADEHNKSMKKAILQIEDEAGEHRYKDMAWTGDVHGVGRIHDDPRFAWLVEQVESHCVEYLKELGHDMERIALYIQRSWPIISRKGEQVAVHSHHNANVSAVYYVDVPTLEEGMDERGAGAFVIHNASNQNELQEGIATESTNAIVDWNQLNFRQGYYLPEPGRLLMFPSKQQHSVDANQTDELRLSVSFDIVMTSAVQQGKETPEFLSPPPDLWKPFAANR